MTKVMHVSCVSLLILAYACSNHAEFKADTKFKTAAEKDAADAAPTPESKQGNSAPEPLELPAEENALPEVPAEEAPAPVAEPAPVPVPEPAKPIEPPPAAKEAPLPPLTLDLSLPSNVIKAGKVPLQAVATTSRPTDSAFVWTVDGPGGHEFGSIDDKGLYTSPATASADFEVTITASLEKDASVKASKVLKILADEVIFVGCKRGNATFPITAEVFSIPVNSPKLPDYNAIASSKVTTVCMDKYNVPVRNFAEGFPEVPDLFEWFSLHTKTKLVIKTAGAYKFKLFSDDGANLYINGKKVVDNDGTHSPLAKEGDITLPEGEHELVLDYYQGPRTQIALQLFWQTPGAADYVIVPTEAFKP